MKLVQKNNTYVDSTTGEVHQNAYVVDGVFAEEGNRLINGKINKALKISFKILKPIVEDFISVNEEGNLSTQKINKTVEIGSSTYEFTEKSDTPTYVNIVNEDGSIRKADLFAYLTEGGQLKGDEKIEIGIPNYQSVQKYFTKDDIGIPLEINPDLDPLGKSLAQKFILEKIVINGEPIGKQFKF